MPSSEWTADMKVATIDMTLGRALVPAVATADMTQRDCEAALDLARAGFSADIGASVELDGTTCVIGDERVAAMANVAGTVRIERLRFFVDDPAALPGGTAPPRVLDIDVESLRYAPQIDQPLYGSAFGAMACRDTCDGRLRIDASGAGATSVPTVAAVDLPVTLVDVPSRTALHHMPGDLPNPGGTLTVSAVADPGLGFPRLATFAQGAPLNGPQDPFAALGGVTLDVTCDRARAE